MHDLKPVKMIAAVLFASLLAAAVRAACPAPQQCVNCPPVYPNFDHVVSGISTVGPPSWPVQLVLQALAAAG